MKNLLALCLVLLVSTTTFGHDATLSEETLKELFPEADGFTERKKSLSPQEILEVERASGDKVQETDKETTLFVALAINDQTLKVQSMGAALMVDVEGPRGFIDLVVAYNLDGSVKKILLTQSEDNQKIRTEAFWDKLVGRGPSDSWDFQKDFGVAGDQGNEQAIILAVRRGMYLFLTFMGQ
jgi:hypothetical protein